MSMLNRRQASLSIVTEHMIGDDQIAKPDLIYNIRASLVSGDGTTVCTVWNGPPKMGTPNRHELLTVEQAVMLAFAQLITAQIEQNGSLPTTV